MKKLALALFLVSVPASATLDPERAQTHVDEAVRRGDDVFCKKPPLQLRGHARDLCPHAEAIQGCEALVSACGQAPPPKATIPKWLQMLGQAALLLLFAGFAVVVGLAILGLVRARRSGPPSEPPAPEEEPAKAAPTDVASESPAAILARANALRESDPEAALSLYLRASLLALDVRGAIHVADDRTNGEYLRECSDGEAKEPLRTIVREVERVRFGRMKAAREMVERVARAAASIAVVLVLVSCDAAERVSQGPNGDPAASSMFAKALVDQGVEVKGAGTLVRLPIPEPIDSPPALIVDLDVVDLEDDAAAHVRAWVEAGGTLVVAGEGAPAFAKTTRALATTTEVRTQRLEEHAVLRTPEGLATHPGCSTLASAGTTPFALLCPVGRGWVLAMATDDLVANAGFARGSNAKVSFEILGSIDPSRVLIASPADGIAPPDSPLASLNRAGLGPGLWHGFFGLLLLFWAAGARLARPKPADPPARRAFVEHVEATGALYSRRHTAGHALEALVRFVEDRVRGDVPLSLSHRTGVNVTECEAIWTRARKPPLGDELGALRALHRLVSRSSSLR